MLFGVGANPQEDSLQKTIDRGIRDRERRKERAQQKDKVKKVRNRAVRKLRRSFKTSTINTMKLLMKNLPLTLTTPLIK